MDQKLRVMNERVLYTGKGGLRRLQSPLVIRQISKEAGKIFQARTGVWQGEGGEVAATNSLHLPMNQVLFFGLNL